MFSWDIDTLLLKGIVLQVVGSAGIQEYLSELLLKKKWNSGDKLKQK